jgi:hypothetical protein
MTLVNFLFFQIISLKKEEARAGIREGLYFFSYLFPLILAGIHAHQEENEEMPA